MLDLEIYKLYIQIGVDSNIKLILSFSVYTTINFLPPKDYSEETDD